MKLYIYMIYEIRLGLEDEIQYFISLYGKFILKWLKSLKSFRMQISYLVTIIQFLLIPFVTLIN